VSSLSTEEHAALPRDFLSNVEAEALSCELVHANVVAHRQKNSSENHQTLAYIAGEKWGMGRERAAKRGFCQCDYLHDTSVRVRWKTVGINSTRCTI
jgi:hypothetical protein